MAGIAVAAASVGGALISGGMGLMAADKQAEAAGDAAALQAQAQREATQLQREIWEQQVETQKPWIQSGGLATQAIQAGLGLAPQYYKQLGSVEEEVAAYGDSAANLNASIDRYKDRFNQPFTYSDLYADPSYEWRLEQGKRALEASASARGGLLTGQAGVDLLNYGQNAASQEYQAAFERYRTNQNDLYTKLMNLSNQGQNTSVQQGSQGTAMAGQMSSTIMDSARQQGQMIIGAGDAGAAGLVGVGNAIGGAASDLAGYQMMMNLIKAAGTTTGQ